MPAWPGRLDSVSLNIHIKLYIWLYIWQYCVFAQRAPKAAVDADKDVWYQCCRLIVLACCIHSSRGCYEWRGSLCQRSSLNSPPPSPLLHCNICIGWNFNFKVHWYSLNLWHLSHCHFQFSSATSFLMWIFLLNFLLAPNMFDHDCDEGYIAKNAIDLDIFLTVFLVHVVKIFSVASKVYNKLRYQTDNRSGDEKLCCNVSFSP